jgi:Flp pilus assembly protein TadG
MRNDRTNRQSPRGRQKEARSKRPRHGNIIVFSAILMVAMMAMLALSVDVGYIYTMQAQLQRSVDSAALAGVQDLVNGVDQAQAAATEYLVRNPVGSSMTFIDESQLASNLSSFQTQHANDFQMQYGNWNPTTRSFTETSVNPSSMTVSMTYPNMPFFFGKVLGKDTFSITASSTAMFQPRDIVVVLDYSASMNDDSTFDAIGKLSRSVVESSLLNCWNDLGPPSYGNLAFTPAWAVAAGVPENTASQIPHVTVEYRNTAVYVTSSHAMTSVKLQFSGGATQTLSTTASTGTFQGSGSNSGKQITNVWVKSWNNSAHFGSSGEPFDFSTTAAFKNALGLADVPYPYANGGSWDSYINYCKSSSSSNQNRKAGYQYKFGGMSLVNYWLDQYPANNQVPDLWKCRAEPEYALKDSMSVFMDFIGSVDTQDRVGLVIYDAADGNAILESPLTDDLDTIRNIVNHRQAGHYSSYTNIGAGMQLGRQHLETNGRANASKLIVLMTDGLANWHNGRLDEAGAAQMISTEASLAAADKFKIMTIALGVGADTATMNSVANTTNGTYYCVPGGTDHQAMHDQLHTAFKEIADARPMLLVK